MIADMLSNKNFNPIVTEFLLLLSHNLISLFQKILDQFQHIILL